MNPWVGFPLQRRRARLAALGLFAEKEEQDNRQHGDCRECHRQRRLGTDLHLFSDGAVQAAAALVAAGEDPLILGVALGAKNEQMRAARLAQFQLGRIQMLAMGAEQPSRA